MVIWYYGMVISIIIANYYDYDYDYDYYEYRPMIPLIPPATASPKFHLSSYDKLYSSPSETSVDYADDDWPLLLLYWN